VVLTGSDGGALFAAMLLAGGTAAGAAVAGLVLAGLPTATTDLAVAGSLPAQVWEAEVLARTASPSHQSLLRRDQGFRPGELTRPLPAGWFAAARPEAIAVPVLGLHGADDEISPLTEVQNWYSCLPRGCLITVAGGRHDVLNDCAHPTVDAAIERFLQQLGPDSGRLVPDAVARGRSTHP